MVPPIPSGGNEVLSMGPGMITGRRKIARKRRIRTRFECHCEATFEQGEASLSNVSYTGALLSDTSVTPPRGDLVRLRLPLPDGQTLEIQGYVVRHIGTGFAVEFEDLDAHTRRLVDDAAGLVNRWAGETESAPDQPEKGSSGS